MDDKPEGLIAVDHYVGPAKPLPAIFFTTKEKLMMPPNSIANLVGDKYSMLTVTSYSHVRKTSGGYYKHYWVCLCECGGAKTAESSMLKLGRTWHCGCQKTRGRHRMSTSPTYNVWRNMMKRCYTVTQMNYPSYGGRGIYVCNRWRHSFESFLADMGEKDKGLELDRIDNNGPYAPENCRWVTKSQNCRNRRSSRILEHNGVALSITTWAETLGMSTQTIAYRLKHGWSTQDALTPP